VPIAENDQTYLSFNWKGIKYQYTRLPFGIAFAPRLFTKLIQPVYASLRNLGHIVLVTLMIAYFVEKVLMNVQKI
jgi:uncharacterized membrane protein